MRRATAMNEATGLDWQIRLSVADADVDDALLSIATIARRWPATLRVVSDRYIFQSLRSGISPPTPERRFDTMQALFEANWTPGDASLDPSGLWLNYTVLLLNRGEAARAREVAAHIHAPMSLIQMQTDRRFDAIVRANPVQFDVDAALERELADLRAASAAKPDKLSALNDVAIALLRRNEAEAALILVDDAIARTHPRWRAARFYRRHGGKLDAEFIVPWLCWRSIAPRKLLLKWSAAPGVPREAAPMSANSSTWPTSITAWGVPKKTTLMSRPGGVYDKNVSEQTLPTGAEYADFPKKACDLCR